MATAQATRPDLDTLDAEALKALILARHAQLCAHETEIEHLKLLLAKLQRQQFGRKSERLDQQIEQLELRLEDLEASQAEGQVSATDPLAPEVATPGTPPRRPARKPLPAHLARKTKTYAPEQTSCPACGGALRPLGEDVSGMLEYASGAT
jgi:transposase